MDLEYMKPYLEITEQPYSYCWFQRPHENITDVLVGANSSHSVLTYPKIRIVNAGRYNARVVVSCICDQSPFLIHPNGIVTRESTAPSITKAEQIYPGVCMMTLTPENPEIEITNIGIQTTDERTIFEKLAFKVKEGIDPFGGGYIVNSKNYDLSVVRLAFETFLEDPVLPEVYYRLRPIMSTEIFDARLLTVSTKIQPDLQISMMSHECGSVLGERIIILTQISVPYDVEVQFYEVNDKNEITWVAMGLILDIHNEYAIVVKTPVYHNIKIDQPVKIYLRLIQPSTKNSSQPREFIMHPIKTQQPVYTKNPLPFKKKYLQDAKEKLRFISV